MSASWKVGVTFLPPVVTQLFCGGYCPVHLYCMASVEIQFKNATLKTKMRSCGWQLPAYPEPQAAPPHPGEGSGNTPLISSLWLFPTRQEGFLQGGRTCGSLKCRVLGCTLQLKARCVFTGTCSEWMFQPGMLTWQSLNASQPPN